MPRLVKELEMLAEGRDELRGQEILEKPDDLKRFWEVAVYRASSGHRASSPIVGLALALATIDLSRPKKYRTAFCWSFTPKRFLMEWAAGNLIGIYFLKIISLGGSVEYQT